MYNRTNEALKNISAVAQQQQYLDLINNRGNMINDEHHKQVVLSGYMKILNFMQRAVR